MQVIRVIAAVVDQYQLTLYKEDGTEHIIKQGDPELRRVLDVVMPIIQDGQVAEVELGKASDEGKQYKDFEEKTNGLVRFFKMLKTEVDSMLNKLAGHDDPVAPLTLGRVPTNNPGVTNVTVKQKETPAAAEAKGKKLAAVNEVLANAVPTTSESFSAPKADQHDENGKLIAEGSETIVAVVGDRVIPGVEKLAGQFEYAAKDGNSTVGMENFLARIGKVIANRRHSVQDLLKFLERGDLPIADDGTFVAYKILRKDKDREGGFVDCHTRNVPQRVGSYVHMDESLVDPNRSNECSNGLHVARRGYIGQFSGDGCTLIKVAPEDVIAVPNYDANKMRVCGYHIIDVLSEDDYRKLRNNNSITDTMAAKIQLGKALAGDHVGVLERVKITEQKGGGIQITPVADKAQAKKAVKAQGKDTKKRVADAIKVKDLDPSVKLDAPKVDAKALAKEVSTAKAAGGSARAIKARELCARALTHTNPKVAYDAAVELLAFKKAAKVSWDKLQIALFEVDAITATAATEPVFDNEPAPAAEAPVKNPVKAAVKPAKAPAKASSKPVKPVKAAPTAVKDRLVGLMLKVAKGDKKAAAEVLTTKKQSKKSWEVLGLTKADGEKCSKLLAKK